MILFCLPTVPVLRPVRFRHCFEPPVGLRLLILTQGFPVEGVVSQVQLPASHKKRYLRNFASL
jgi:hypothetical protein